MASKALESGKSTNQDSISSKVVRPKRILCSLMLSASVPLFLNAVTIFLFGYRRGFPGESQWTSPLLFLIHSASIGSSLLMGIASWLVWAGGGMRLDSDVLPLYVAQVSLGIVWDPLVLAFGSCQVGFVFCVANFGTLVACRSSFGKVNRLAGNITNVCTMWAGLLAYVTLQHPYN